MVVSSEYFPSSSLLGIIRIQQYLQVRFGYYKSIFVLLSSVPVMINVSKDVNNAQGNVSDHKYLQQCERVVVMLIGTNTTDSKGKTFKKIFSRQ